jgi:hypothetical protein
VAVEAPETESISTSLVGKRANDGKWHTVSVLIFASSGRTVVDLLLNSWVRNQEGRGGGGEIAKKKFFIIKVVGAMPCFRAPVS